MKKSKIANPSRRAFVALSAKALTAACGGLFLGSSNNRAYASSLNEIRFGLVGCGGRGTNLVRNALKAHKSNKLVAMGDVFQDRLDTSVQTMIGDKRINGQFNVPRGRKFIGFDAYKKVLDAGIDFVFFTTPAAFRPLHFSAAVQAGKHSYIEKPFAVDSPGVRAIQAAGKVAKQKRLSVSSGLTHRHSDRYRTFVDRIQDQSMGSVKTLELIWNAWFPKVVQRQPSTTEIEYQIRNFQLFTWASGGPLLERLIHTVDNCNWLLNSHPVSATGQGSINSQLGDELGDVFGKLSTKFRYPGDILLDSRFSFVNGNNSVKETMHGDGWYADMSKSVIYQKNNKVQWRYNKKRDNSNLNQLSKLFSGLQNGEVEDEVDYSCDATWSTIMGRMAAHLGREVTWQETIESNQVFAPVEITRMDQIPPTRPDKFGDYVLPATSVKT